MIDKCIEKGISVIEKDIDKGIQDFELSNFDIAIMASSIQCLKNPNIAIYLYIKNYIDKFTCFNKLQAKNMKNIILKTALLFILMSCGSGDKGELVGVKGKKYFAEKPFGMALVPGGSFIMGKSDDDLVGIEDAPTKYSFC